VAIIEETSKRTQGLYYIGDSIQQAPVKSILNRRIVLSVDGKDEILMMDDKTDSSTSDESSTVSVAAVSTETTVPLERTITIRSSVIADSLDNISELLSQASIRPHYEDGEADGLAITGIKAGSIFRRMGLRNGDIVKGINGNEITSPEDLISLYNDLKSESDVSLQIVRRGAERSLNYIISD
jgi:general secretion pathway protein C